MVETHVVWSYRPYQKLGQINHDLHSHAFDEVIRKTRYVQPAETISQHFGVSLNFSFEIKIVLPMNIKCMSKIFHLKCVYFGQPVSENFGLLTYINVQLKPWFLTMHCTELELTYKNE